VTETEDGAQAPVRVYLLDDHELLRRGLREVLEDAGGFEVVGETGSARVAARRIPALRPHVALLDVRLPDGSGVEVCRQVRARDPKIRALMVTTYDDDESRLAAAVAGAAGFVLKQIDAGELVAAVRRVAAGEVLIDTEQRQHAVERVTSGPDARVQVLTGQERRVLGLLAEGLSNRQIGERLGLTEKTVKNYVYKVLLKLGFERRTQAAVFGARVDAADRPF